MGRRHRRKRKGREAPRPSGSPPRLGEAEAIARLLDEGAPKEALRRAQALHGARPSAESEALLGRAYVERLRSMGSQMAAEADALMELAARRCPAIRPQLDELRPLLDARFGRFDQLFLPLADPELPAARRHAIEEVIRREATDLDGLAACPALPQGHPLRLAASALARAFARVTGGPLADEQMALPEISHRSPLASWKLLVRAMDSFYRHDDHGCEAWLSRIDPEAAVARLVPALRAMMGNKPAAGLGARGRRLAAGVCPDASELRRSLLRLDGLLARKVSPSVILKDVRAAVAACQRLRPDLLEKLRQHISIRCTVAGLTLGSVERALGGFCLHDARFFRLMALALEQSPMIEQVCIACGCWEEFRRLAVHEGWIAPQGPQVAAIYQHMAKLLTMIDPDDLESGRRSFIRGFDGFAAFYCNQPERVRAAAPGRGKPDLFFVDPERLFERASTADPDPEIFEQWLCWARRARGDPAADRAALAWHRSLPSASRPLIELMQSAERRGALKKALSYLEDAERIDGLDPRVGRARLRLLLATAIRHLKNRKPHLLAKDIQELAVLPQLQQGDRPALLPALSWAQTVPGRNGESEKWRGEVRRLLGSEAATGVLLDTLLASANLSSQVPSSFSPEPVEPGMLTSGIARGCALAQDLGLVVKLKESWASALAKDLSNVTRLALAEGQVASPGPDLGHLLALGRAALGSGQPRLAHAAATVGLLRAVPLTGPESTRFLSLKACSLPAWEEQRRHLCLEAVRSLARRSRDTELLNEVADAEAGRLTMTGSEEMGSEQVLELLRAERTATEYPERRSPALAVEAPCDCPACRRKRTRQRRRSRPTQLDVFDALFEEAIAGSEEESEENSDEDSDENSNEDSDEDSDEEIQATDDNVRELNEMLEDLLPMGRRQARHVLMSQLLEGGMPRELAAAFVDLAVQTGTLDLKELLREDPAGVLRVMAMAAGLQAPGCLPPLELPLPRRGRQRRSRRSPRR